MYRSIKQEELRVAKDTGYAYFNDKYHPLVCKGSYRIYYHRHIMSIYLGRWINSEEHVHHLDGNKLNNSIDNLVICTAAEHTKLHKGEILVRKCIHCNKEFIPSQNRIKFCSVSCYKNSLIKDSTLTKELLDSLIPTMSWVALGKKFGYSDNGIKKRAIALGCDIKKLRG